MVDTITWEQVNEKGHPLLSPGVKSNGHVFTSGCVGTDSEGNFPESVAEQTENAIHNLKKVLQASGTSIDKVMKVLLFISHPSYAAEVNAIYGKHFTTRPGRSCIVVGFPNPAIKVELECVAEYRDLSAKL